MTGAAERVPRLEAGGLCFRPWRDADADAVRALAADEDAWRWMPTLRRVHDSATALAWVRARHDDDRVDWAVCDPVTDAVVGRVGLHRFTTSRGAETGYAVWPGNRRRGIAALMVTTATAHALGPMGLARVTLRHATGNLASCRVAARCGFALEGTERAGQDHGDGVLHDLHVHARLATDPPGAVPAAAGVEPVEISAGQWHLRPPATEDAAEALAMLSDPLTVRWNPAPDVVDLERARAWCERGGDWRSGNHATFSVLDATSGRMAGNVSLWQVDLAARSASIGYRTAPWARGRGAATDAVGAVSRWAFGGLGLERIELPHAPDNLASCRVAEKCGFRAEGTRRGGYRAEDGTREDEHVHSRLATD